MKRVVYAAEVLEHREGFLGSFSRFDMFIESPNTNLTDKVIRKFINEICDYRKVGDKIRQAALYDKPTLDDYRHRISRATLECRDTGRITYYNISGDSFTLNDPEEDVEKLDDSVYIFK